MIIKLAFDPLTTAAALTGLKAATAGGAAFKVLKDTIKRDTLDTLVSGNLHDLQHYLTSKSNKFGKAIQRAAMSDIITSTKMGTEGKVWANRKLLPSLFYSGQEAKAIATFESNAAARQAPGLKYLFKGNRFQTNRFKNVLRAADTVDAAALAGQVAAPSIMGVKSFNNEYKKSHDFGRATRHGLMGAAAGGLISAGLEIPRRIAGASAGLHRSLSANQDYGYKILDEAARSAEISMNRPSIINYSKHFYTTPEKNVKAWTGRLMGDNLKRLMGQKVMKPYDPVRGYNYGDEHERGALRKVLDQVDIAKNKTVNTVFNRNSPA